MRKLAITMLVLLAAPATSRAEGFGIGLFLGDPAGLDLNIGLQPRSSLDVLIGWNTFRDNRTGYAHITYLYTVARGRGRSVSVPFRIGIGGAAYGNDNDVNLAARAPLELGLRFRGTPLEIYGELAILLTFFDDNGNHDDVDLQGGLGLRFYF